MGRGDDVDLRIDDPGVSRRHAQIVLGDPSRGRRPRLDQRHLARRPADQPTPSSSTAPAVTIGRHHGDLPAGQLSGGPMSDLSLFLIKIGYLALLWVFVLVVAAAMRRDLMPRRRRTSSGRGAHRDRAARAGGRQGTQAGEAAEAREAQARSAPHPHGHRGLAARHRRSISARRRSPSAAPPTTPSCSTTTTRRATTPGCGPYDGGWLVEDLGSTNGTFLDKAKVTAPTPVPVGVPVRIGKTALELRK